MQLIVDVSWRYAKQRAHTATHLLHYLLDELLQGTKQAWSLVDDDYLRFDFAAKEPLSQEQIITIEQKINAWIALGAPVQIQEMSLQEAKKLWAKAFFEDKYGDVVRVISIEGVSAVPSVEFCGWTHVENTRMIGACKITAQEAVASWIRRLEAVTGPKVALFAQEKEQEQIARAKLLDCSPKQLTEKIQKLLTSLEEKKQQYELLQQSLVTQSLWACQEFSSDELQYLANIETLWIQWIPLKQIALCARSCRAWKNRILYTSDGQFALCADATKNAKALQKKYWLTWGGDDQLIQGKDERIKDIDFFAK